MGTQPHYHRDGDGEQLGISAVTIPCTTHKFHHPIQLTPPGTLPASGNQSTEEFEFKGEEIWTQLWKRREVIKNPSITTTLFC